MFCFKCGKQISDGAQFCEFCGAKQVAGKNESPSSHISKFTKEEQNNIVGMAAELATVIQIEEEELNRLESERFTVIEPTAPVKPQKPELPALVIPPKPVRPKAPEKIPFSEAFPQPLRPVIPEVPKLKTVNEPQYVTPVFPDAQLKDFNQWAYENSGFNRFLFNETYKTVIGIITFVSILPILLFGFFGVATDLLFAKTIAIALLIIVIVPNLYAIIIMKKKSKQYDAAAKQINSDAYTEEYHMAFSSAVNDANTKNQKIKAAYEAQCRAAQEQYNKEVDEYKQAVQRYPLALKEYEKALEEWKKKESEMIEVWNAKYNEELETWKADCSQSEKAWESYRKKIIEEREEKYKKNIETWESDWNCELEVWNSKKNEWNLKKESWNQNHTSKMSFVSQDLDENKEALKALYEATQLIPNDYRTADRLLWLYKDMSTSEHDIERSIDLLNHKETSDLLRNINDTFSDVRSIVKEGFNAVYSEIQEEIALMFEVVNKQNTIIENQNTMISNQKDMIAVQVASIYGQAEEVERLNAVIDNQDMSNALSFATLVQQNEMFSSIERIRKSARTSNFLIGGSLLNRYLMNKKLR